MDPKAVTKVGTVSVLALSLFALLYIYLAHLNPNTYVVRVGFKDTQGLMRQSIVRMQGVQIGEVTGISLDTRQTPFTPVATLAIKNQYRIPEGSRVTLQSGLLIQTPVVIILPSTSATSLPVDGTAYVSGEMPQSLLAQQLPELSQTMTKLNTTMDGLNVRFGEAYKKIDKILDQTQTVMATTNRTLTGAQQLISDPRLKGNLYATVGNFRQVSENARDTARDLSRDLRQIVKTSKGPLEKLPVRISDLLGRLDTTLDQANDIVKRVTDQVTDPRFQQSLQETAELARTTLARFNQIASDLHELTGDPRLQSDLKETVSNLRATTARTEQVVEKVDTLLGKITGPNGKLRTPRLNLPSVSASADFSEQLSPGRFRTDLNARIESTGRDTLDVGLYDVGQTTRVNLQGGRRIGEAALLRYGLHASKLGVGLDIGDKKPVGFSADLWNSLHPQLDVKALFRVNSNASIWAGADGLFQRPVPIVGIRIRN